MADNDTLPKVPAGPEMPLVLPLEIAVFGPDEALRAQKYGAERIELNAKDSYCAGGTTPTVEDLCTIAPHLTVPVRIMIRPRGPRFSGQGPADFIYDRGELDLMRTQITQFKECGHLDSARGDGFVFGILEEKSPRSEKPDDPETTYFFIDKERCSELVELTRPFACIFHRAFDPIAATSRLDKGMRTLQDLGFCGVLTAGGRGDFWQNCDRIEHMAHMTVGEGFQIIVGGGVRHHNVKSFIERIASIRGCDVAMHSAVMGGSVTSGDGGGDGILSADFLLKLTHVLACARPD